MKIVSIKDVGLPIYNGLESTNEDLVYSYLRSAFGERGYSIKVKRSGHIEIDSIIRSWKKSTHGKGSCDAYIFSGHSYKFFKGLIELESTGKLSAGIAQIKDYMESFTAKSLPKDLQYAVAQIEERSPLAIVFDGNLIWAARYSLDTKKWKTIINNTNLSADRFGASAKLFNELPDVQGKVANVDEKNLVEQVANRIRGHEKFQKNKALVMTILASMFGATHKPTYEEACSNLKSSQDGYDLKIFSTLGDLKNELGENCEDLLSDLYSLTASSLYELSQDKGMDLYGFIYEELATKDSKKEQGEYYTPRHTIRPILSSVYRNYLKWDKKVLKNKVILDPFCGSGGFLYEYIHLQKTVHSLTQDEVDDIAKASLFGMDKNNILAAYLNLYLIGDGSANLRKVSTTINWRQEMFHASKASKKRPGKKVTILRESDGTKLTPMIKSRSGDLDFLLHLYSPISIPDKKEKELAKIASEGHARPIDALILSKMPKGSSSIQFGMADLLLTNVPYGKIANPLEQFLEDNKTPYGGSLEANALRECIDFLRPARMENGTIKDEGGVAVVIVPDSILENPSNKAIRDYLIARCEILAIVGLPPFTFSPYAMEKTYALVFRKLAAEQFDVARDLSASRTFMYYSLSDGKANSVNRFPTGHIVKTEIKLLGGKKKTVVEFAHNDFDPCFDSYFDDSHLYLSKLERSWDSATWALNPEWDQKRLIEQWTGSEWKSEPGKKWGYFSLIREDREYREVVKAKSLSDKLSTVIPLENLISSGDVAIDFSDYANEISSLSLSTKEKEILVGLSDGEAIYDSESKLYSVLLYRLKKVTDIVLNPDDHRYLGTNRPSRYIENTLSDLQKLSKVDEESVIEYFRSQFKSKNKLKAFKLIEKFDVIQGTQFSKSDAYKCPGSIPVYTAATDGPAYYCAKNIPGKVFVEGPALIWSRKGAKAGTIQMFAPKKEGALCYISDVSGAIKQKNGSDIDLTFMRYYIAGQVKAQIQAQDNNAQLNKSKLESLEIFLPPDHQAIGNFLQSNGL